MQVHIRPGTAADLPQIARLDLLANPTSPTTYLPWAKPTDAYPLFLSRYTYYFNHPAYHFLIATPASPENSDEVIGHLIWRKKLAGQNFGVEEWNPTFPEGFNLAFFAAFLEQGAIGNREWKTDELYELDAIAVSPSHQRQGIGKQLLEKFLEEVDRDGEPVFLRATSSGKPLYEKYGWTTLKEITHDLTEYGQPEGHTTTAMRREGRKKQPVFEIA